MQLVFNTSNMLSSISCIIKNLIITLYLYNSLLGRATKPQSYKLLSWSNIPYLL